MTETGRAITDEIAAEKADAVLDERDGRWVLTMTRPDPRPRGSRRTPSRSRPTCWSHDCGHHPVLVLPEQRRLEPGVTVEWFGDMYDVSTTVAVQRVEQDRSIVVDFADDDPPTRVEWRFVSRSDDTMLVRITETGFGGDGDPVAASAIDSKGGFTIVLAGLKALLEHGVELPLVADAFPDGVDSSARRAGSCVARAVGVPRQRVVIGRPSRWRPGIGSLPAEADAGELVLVHDRGVLHRVPHGPARAGWHLGVRSRHRGEPPPGGPGR